MERELHGLNGEYFYENRKNQNKAEIVFAGDWLSVKYKSDLDRKFFEYCYYFDRIKQVVSVIWEACECSESVLSMLYFAIIVKGFIPS